jgi:hypothetical protein
MTEEEERIPIPNGHESMEATGDFAEGDDIDDMEDIDGTEPDEYDGDMDEDASNPDEVESFNLADPPDDLVANNVDD